MSTGLNCNFIEGKPGKWYLLLEQSNAPKDAWDWREYADCFGPFASSDAADSFLRRHFANPGGSCTIPYSPSFEKDSVLQDALKTARLNRNSLRRH